MAPWWWVRWRAASPAERLWRLLPAAPATPCPPGPAPRWPWPVPAIVAPPPPALPPPPPPRWPPDPKPAWAAHRLHAHWLAGLAGHPVDVDAWWAAAQRSPGLWASTHPVAERIPALAALGHREALWAHHDHLRRHPSRFSSAANHRVAELAAQALARRCAPDLPAPPPLRPALAALLHADGWGREQSVAYLAYILEWATIAHRCGEDLADLLQRGQRALAAVLADRGDAPAIGDDGGDAALPGPEPYAASVVGLVAAALGTSTPAGWQPGLRAALLGLDAPPSGPRPPARCLPDGGVTALRSRSLHVVLDHGPMGLPPLYGHAHADALALWAHRDGAPWLVGRGTASYHHAGRGADRDGSGENTLAVDGLPAAVPHAHPFLWRRVSGARLDGLRVDADGGWVAGARHLGPLTHRREVAVDGGQLRVLDHLDGSGVAAVTLRWHLHPDARWGPVTHPLPATFAREPHADRYGAVRGAETAQVRGEVRLPVTLVTRFG